MTVKKPLVLSAATALALAPMAFAAPAMAASSSTNLQGSLTQLNDSGVTANVTGSVSGTELTINITPSGQLAEAPHAQHIHIGGTNSCPTNDEDGSGADGALQVSDAVDRYGDIAVSLTTEGDTSPESGLAVDRFPVGDASYSRTLEVSQEVADQIANGDGVVVLHGVDQNGSGTYDGDEPSDLDPSLPEEATNPSACGTLDVAQAAAPGGGVDTGGGATSGNGQSVALLGGGLALMAVGAGAYVVRRRTVADQA